MSKFGPTRVVVNADFSQFYLRFTDQPVDMQEGFMPTYVPLAAHGTGLAYFSAPGDLLLAACRQFGLVDVDVEVHADPVTAAVAENTDVVELSFTATQDVRLSGWEAWPADPQIPLEPDVEYRLRYSVVKADAADTVPAPPYPESYRLEFWTAPATPPMVVSVESGWARRAVISREIDVLTEQFMWLTPRDELSEAQRVEKIATTIFTRFPDVAREIRNGRTHWAGRMGRPQLLGYVAGEADPPWSRPGAGDRLAAEIERIARDWPEGS